jgi:hypothetical protein
MDEPLLLLLELLLSTLTAASPMSLDDDVGVELSFDCLE